MVQSCPNDCASYLVWDDAKTNKVIGIFYSNDNLPTGKKVVGSSGWIQVRKAFEQNGIGKNLDTHDDSDMQYDYLSKKFK